MRSSTGVLFLGMLLARGTLAYEERGTVGSVKQLLARALDQLKERFGDTASLSLPERALKMGDGEDA